MEVEGELSMKLYGYSCLENDEKSEGLQLKEASLECTISELEKIISFLKEERLKLIDWAKSYDGPLFADDFAELQCPTNDKETHAYFLINLKSVIDKYTHNSDD